MQKSFHQTTTLFFLLIGLTNCATFAKSTNTISDGINAIAPRKSPTYDEDARGDYMSYKRYRKAYEAWQKKQEYEKLMQDKSLEKAFPTATKKN